MRDRANIVRLEAPHDLEGLRQDAHDSICAAEENALGSGCDGGYIPWLYMIGQSDLKHHGATRSYL